MSEPRLLDAFSGAGGAARGYQQAGFHVTGIDIAPQPRYAGDAFIQGDALAYLADVGFVRQFDVVHASPPCHDHSSLSALSGPDDTGWLLDATRERLEVWGGPYVIENVIGAAMTHRIVLCGSSFGLNVWRHRQFESNVMFWNPPRCRHDLVREPLDVTGTGGPSSRPRKGGGGTSRKPRNLEEARAALGIDWMTREELSQAIPPAYTRFVGGQLLAVVGCGMNSQP